MKRLPHARWIPVLAAALLAAPALPAAADHHAGPIAWVILDTVKPGKSADYIRLVTENYGPTLDGMMAEGKLLGWGLAEKANADGGYTHAGWAVYPSWAAYQAVEDAFGAAFADVPPEDQAALATAFADATEPHAHLIRLLRSVTFETAENAPPPRYLVTGDWYALPGKDKEALALLQGAGPIFEGLLTSGALVGGGIYRPELHDGSSTYVTWYSFTDLGAMDKLNDAFAAAGDDAPSSAAMAALFDMNAHRDTLWQIRHLGGAPGEGGGGENGEE